MWSGCGAKASSSSRELPGGQGHGTLSWRADTYADRAGWQASLALPSLCHEPSQLGPHTLSLPAVSVHYNAMRLQGSSSRAVSSMGRPHCGLAFISSSSPWSLSC